MPTPSQVIALVGNPNCGKTTVFNALTGMWQQVGNWAGVTVEQVKGYFCVKDRQMEVIDLPGTYTLTQLEGEGPQDESITSRLLNTYPFSLVLNIVDASNLTRNLYLTLQCLEQRLPTLIVLNRIDLLEKTNERICINTLSASLGSPVIALSARQKKGIEDLKQVLSEPFDDDLATFKSFSYPPAIETALEHIEKTSETIVRRYQLLRWLEGEPVKEVALAKEIEKAKEAILNETGMPPDSLIAKARYDFIEKVVKKSIQPCASQTITERQNLTVQVDKIVCHRYLGLPLFLLVMYLLFFFAIQGGGLFKDFIESSAQTIFVDLLRERLTDWQAPGWVIALLVSGVGTGIASVLSFVPIIGAMFLGLAFLEDSGYMARAAFVIDRLMRLMGLPGKSLVPMIVGFGCNVPAIMGTRALDNRRDRILAIMMTPFMSCGARLAIFTVFVAAFFPKDQHNVVFLLYFIGITMAMLTALLLKKTLLKGQTTPLLLEMPTYQWPHWQSLWLHAWHRLCRFVLNTGSLIVSVCVVIGMLNSINLQGEWAEGEDTALLAVIGQKIVPLFKPFGMEADNWPAAVALLTGTLAKEVVIGTLNTLYAQDKALPELHQHFHDTPSVFAYLLFVLLYFPCVSATAAMLREVKRKWTLFSVCWTTGLAYCVAVFYYQCATFAVHPLESSGWILAIFITGIVIWKGFHFYARAFLPRAFPTRIVLI